MTFNQFLPSKLRPLLTTTFIFVTMGDFPWLPMTECGSCVTFIVILFPFMSIITWYSFSLSVISSTQNIVYPLGCSSDSLSVDAKWCFSATHLINIWLCPYPFSWWLRTTLFLLSSVTARHQVLYLQTIMAFCLFGFLHNNSNCHLFLSVAYASCHFSSACPCTTFYDFLPQLTFVTQFCDIPQSSLHPLSYFKSFS